MITRLVPIVILALVAATTRPSQAEDRLSKTGKTLLEDRFDDPTPAAHWRMVIGDFHVEDGKLIGNERAEDKHGAVTRAQTKLKDGIVEFSFRLGPSKTFNLVFDQRGFKGSHAGHLCRVVVNRSLIRLADDKEGYMRNDIFEMKKDPNRKAEADKLLEGRSANFKTTIDPEKWYVLRVAVVGDVMQVGLDGKFIGELKSPGIAHDEKTDIGFTVIGQGAQFDNFKITEVEAR